METYRMIRNEISVKNMLETVDSLSGWERLSGSKQEMEAAHYLEGRLQSFGYDVKIDLCDAYISLPLEAVLQVDSKPMRAQTHSLVPTAHVKAPMIFCENEADIARTNCCGKIVLTPGRAVFGPVEAAQRTGAVGAIFIQEAVIRECIPSACWGSPTMGDWDLLPSIPDELYYQVQQRIEEKEEVHMNLW